MLKATIDMIPTPMASQFRLTIRLDDGSPHIIIPEKGIASFLKFMDDRFPQYHFFKRIIDPIELENYLNEFFIKNKDFNNVLNQAIYDFIYRFREEDYEHLHFTWAGLREFLAREKDKAPEERPLEPFHAEIEDFQVGNILRIRSGQYGFEISQAQFYDFMRYLQDKFPKYYLRTNFISSDMEIVLNRFFRTATSSENEDILAALKEFCGEPIYTDTDGITKYSVNAADIKDALNSMYGVKGMKWNPVLDYYRNDMHQTIDIVKGFKGGKTLMGPYTSREIIFKAYNRPMTNKEVGDGLVRKIIVNGPATIVFWHDGTKTVVKCQKGDTYDLEKAFAMAFLKHKLGNEGKYNAILHYILENKVEENE